jgi:hypothetical protein
LDSLEKFLEFRIEKITSEQSIPVDLSFVCHQIGVVVEDREMIPKAVVRVANGRFHIYLQSNFAATPGLVSDAGFRSRMK